MVVFVRALIPGLFVYLNVWLMVVLVWIYMNGENVIAGYICHIDI